jgi:hypothetical protein
MSDDTIRVEVWLYGDLKKYGGQAAELAHARLGLELAAGTRMRDLLAQLVMPLEEKGLTFVNGDLTDMPGLQADLERVLADGDRVGLFSRISMWPSHYRFGAAASPELKDAARKRGGLMHHAFSADEAVD